MATPSRSLGFRVRLAQFTVVLAALGILAAARRAEAVVVAGSSITDNTSAPPAEPGLGWANVGSRGIGSGVYLGNRWVLTANHVGGGSIALNNGQTYAMEVGSGRQLRHPPVGSEVMADLFLFQLTTDPGLPALTLAAQTNPGDLVMMIGNGMTRGAPTGTTGYALEASRTMAWGLNAIEAKENFSINSAYVEGYKTLFATSEMVDTDSDSGQATAGDSGGAVFRLDQETHTWDLAGIIVGRELGPGDQVTFGVSRTYIADLPAYRDQIVQITAVPEPAAGMLAATGLLVLAAIRIGRRETGVSAQPRRFRSGLSGFVARSVF